jgi:cysteine-rich repeat protein
MARFFLTPTCLAGLIATTAALAGCHVSGCREGDQACTMLAETTATTSTADTTGGQTTGAPTSSMDTSSSTTEVTLTEADTTTAPGVCGDGVPDDGDDDDTDECTGQCKLPRCGDGFVHPPEICDAGPGNSDKVYGGCGTNCQWGPGCGDGKLNGPEDCDDKNTDPHDGCLVGCVEATSCKQILEQTPGAPSGNYRIWPTALGGGIDLSVYCDMETDGGGYTFLKVDVDSPQNDLPYPASKAETICAQYGMHLFVPRSAAHLASAYGFATVDNVLPVGGGSKGSSVDYLQILGIYPVIAGKSCLADALNPGDCPEWAANDGDVWYVSDVVKNMFEPDPDGSCKGCSMVYTWNPDGTVKNYKTAPAPGGSSLRFLCDVGDKLPR